MLSRDRFANKPIVLLPWQTDWIDKFFGTGEVVGGFFERTYRHSRIWTPRKNGKSSFLAGLALWLALEKHGNEVLIVAATKLQADQIYLEAKFMAAAHPSLARIFWTRDHRKRIECRHNHSVIKVVAAKPEGCSGHNGDVLIDELTEIAPSVVHQVWGKLQNTGASRLNSALITISHANYHMGEHIGFTEFLRSKAILEAREKGEPDPDPTCLPVVYSADLERVDDLEEWRRCNPGWGVTISPKEFEADYKKSKGNAREWNRFLLFRLNCFVGALESYIPEADYARAEVDFDEADLIGASGVVWGLDLSRRRDLSVYVMLIPRDGLLYLIPRIFTPLDTLKSKSRQDKVDYESWSTQGHIIPCPGDTIDQEFLLSHIREDAEKFFPLECRYDPWNADLLAQQMTREGIVMAEAPCNRSSFLVPPTAELERAFARGIIRVPRNPCLKWCFSNAVTKNIGADNIIVAKSQCTARVDACIASIIAMSAHMARQDAVDIDSMVLI